MRPTPALALMLLCLPLGFAACGDDDGEGDGAGAQVFEVEATDKGGEARVTTPDTVRPGAVEIRFSNMGESAHSLQIVRIGEGHTAAEIKKAGEAWGERGGRLPDWITFAGGIGTTEPGGSGIAVVDLPAGDYAAFDIDGGGPRPYAEFAVEGDEGEALPEVPAEIDATEYAFEPTALEAGSQPVLLENDGAEPHHLVAAPLKPGKTIADVKDFIKTQKGESPIVERDSFNTAIVSGGESEVVDIRLESGDYALLCFVSDRAGGPPHVAKGMAAVTTVK